MVIPKNTSTESKVERGFQIKVYSKDLKNLNLALDHLRSQLKSKVKIIRLPKKVISHIIPKNPHGRGYRVYVKMSLSISRALVVSHDLKVLASCRRILKTLGLYMTLKLQ